MIFFKRGSFVVALSLAGLAAACSGSGGGGGGPETNPPPVQPPRPAPKDPSPSVSGLVSACAGSMTARLDFVLPGAGYESAIFQAPNRNGVYAGGPLQVVSQSPLILNGLVDGADTYFGLAIRATGTTSWQPVGATLRVRPGAPIYVDAAADPVGANGQSPATAFASLADALLVAGAQGAGNVWVKNGTYSTGPFFVGPNVHCAGGFGATFDLASRDAVASMTRVTGSTTQEIFSVISGGADASLDGLEVDGGNAVLKGVDIVDSDVELRALTVHDCIDRGVKAVVTAATPQRRLQIVCSNMSGNGGDGVSTSGPYEIVLDKSQFDANGQEGIDVDDLNVLSGGSSSLHASGCRFFGNSFEGLDVDLSAIGGAPANIQGSFVVAIEGCSFEVNGLDGLLIDQEHEFFPNLQATISVVGCTARANRQAGIHIDADAVGTYRVDRVRCTANTTDGLLVTSESNAGEVVVTSSWFAANHGLGVHLASGNKSILMSHCGVAGNSVGGLRSDAVPCGIANSVFLLQGAPAASFAGAGNYTADGSTPVFVVAPDVFTTVSANSLGVLTVPSSQGFAIGDSVRVADEATAYMVAGIGPATVTLDQDPPALLVPGSLQGYAGADVTDDLRLVTGSPAAGRGVTAAGDPVADAGPFGAANGGEPGTVDVFASASLLLTGATPPLATGVTALQPLTLNFDRDVDVATVTSERVVAIAGGTQLTVSLSVVGGTISLAPPAGGWPVGTTIQLRGSLQAIDGSPLAAPLNLPLTVL